MRGALKAKILYCLENDEQSRNSDIRLTQLVWHHFYNDKLFDNEEGRPCIRVADLAELPTQDDIKRLRAKIQNEEHKFLPTTEEVRRQRKIKEEEWRLYCSPSNPSRG